MENLVSDSVIEEISGGSEYQVRHYGAPDISRRGLATPTVMGLSASFVPWPGVVPYCDRFAESDPPWLQVEAV